MLKKVLLNRKFVPVPIPIRDLGGALTWIEKTLVPSGHSLTKLIVDGKDFEACALPDSTPLGENSRVEVQVDSPLELAVQTLEALKNLATMMARGSQHLAVDCWRTPTAAVPARVDGLREDIELVHQLLTGFQDLVDKSQKDVRVLLGMEADLGKIEKKLAQALAALDWKAYSRALVAELEPFLMRMIESVENLQNAMINRNL